MADVATHPAVEAERRDHPLAVLELEELLHRFAVPGGRRHVHERGRCRLTRSSRRTPAWQRVDPAIAASTPSPSRRRVVARSFTSFCRFTQPSLDRMTTLSSSTMKASAEYSTSSVSSMRVRRRSIFGSPYFFWISGSSSRTSVQRLLSSLSSASICRARLRFSRELVLDDEDLEPRQSIQLQLEDGVGLLGVQLEALDDLLGRVGLAVGLADDADDLVERVEDLLEALEDVDALLQLRQLVLEARGHHVQAEVEEVPEHLLQVEPLGAADLGVLGRHQAGQVDREGGLERGVLEQVRHHQVLVGARLQLQLDAHVVGGEIPDVHQVRHLAAEHDVANLLDELRLVDAVRHAR